MSKSIRVLIVDPVPQVCGTMFPDSVPVQLFPASRRETDTYRLHDLGQSDDEVAAELGNSSALLWQFIITARQKMDWRDVIYTDT